MADKKVDAKGINLKRLDKPVTVEDKGKEPPPVSASPIGMFMDFAFNPTREKIREVTIIDRTQGRLLPQLDLISMMWDYVIQVATYRKDSKEYEKLYKQKQPIPPNLMDEYMYRLAQWQKSIGGKNLERATDITLAEMETKGEDEGDIPGGRDPWEDK